MLAEKMKKKGPEPGMMGREYAFGQGAGTPGYEIEIGIEPAEPEMEDTSASALPEIYPADSEADPLSLEKKMRKPGMGESGMML